MVKKAIKYVFRLICTLRVKRQAQSYGNALYVNKWSKVTPKTRLGDNVNFNGMVISGAGHVSIGNNFHSGTDCMIITGFHNYDMGDAIPYDNTYINKDVVIEDNVWIGSRVIILGGVVLGEGSIIQAGSVVTKNIPPFAVAGGHPAKPFKMRNIEHYTKLKSESKFN